MNRIVKISLFGLFFLMLSQVGVAQKKKKGKKNKSCPEYTEDLQSSLPEFDMPTFEPDTTELAEVEEYLMDDDSIKADSVQGVLKNYLSNKEKTAGWRIQVWTGQKESGVNAITARYNEHYEELGFYVHEIWDQTFFRVKIGDFTDRLEAYKALRKIKEHFPTALLVPDKVDLDKI